MSGIGSDTAEKQRSRCYDAAAEWSAGALAPALGHFPIEDAPEERPLKEAPAEAEAEARRLVREALKRGAKMQEFAGESPAPAARALRATVSSR